jgi:serine/threonine protein kinase
MTTIPNYTILKPIYESPNSLVYRAVRNDNQQPVILKQLQADYPTPAELSRYHHELEILSQLQLPGVIRAYDLKPYQNTLLLVVEDFSGDSLTLLTQQQLLEPLPTRRLNSTPNRSSRDCDRLIKRVKETTRITSAGE